MASAAYRSAAVLHDTRLDKTFDYSRKAGHLHGEIILPTGVVTPEWMHERHELWNGLEASHSRKNARLATELTVALPADLDADQRLALAQDYAQQLADRYGVAVDLNLHAPDRQGDQRNFHAHFMLTARRVGPDGFGGRYDFAYSSTERKALGMIPLHFEFKSLRTTWARTANEHLAAAGLESRIDPRSFRERGIEIEPSYHLGPKATAEQRVVRGARALAPDAPDILVAQTPDAEIHNAEVIRRDPEQLLRILTSGEAVFSKQDIAAAVYRYVGHHPDFAAVLSAVMNSPELVTLQGDVRLNAAGERIEQQAGRQVDQDGLVVEDPARRVTDSHSLADVARFSTSAFIDLETTMAMQAGELAGSVQIPSGPSGGVSADPLAAARQAGIAVTNAAHSKPGKPFGLTEEQLDAVQHVTANNRLSLVVGVAGAGKSTMLEAARRTWEGAGMTVVGAALAGKAAEGLKESSGIGADTIASLIYGWDARDAWNKLAPAERAVWEGASRAQQFQWLTLPEGHPNRPAGTPPPRNLVTLTDKHVLVIDEAGMVDSRTMARLVGEAHQRGAKLALVGDPGQLAAIAAGASFRALAERVGYAEIATVYRQREDWQRQATIDLSKGKVSAAIEAYAERGSVELAPNIEAARARLVADYMADWALNPAATRLALAHRNADVDAINMAVRDARRLAGQVAAAEHVFAARGLTDDAARPVVRNLRFSVGDRVQFLAKGQLEIADAAPNRWGTVPRLKIQNSELGTVTATADGRLVIQPDRKDAPAVVVESRTYKDIAHGYAVTVHKSQGATADRTFMLASRSLDRALSYVGLSRHRDNVKLYASQDEFTDLDALKTGMGRWTLKESTLDYAKTFLSTGQDAWKGWIAEESVKRLERLAAKRETVEREEGWSAIRKSLRSMSPAELARTAHELRPVPIKPSDIENSPSVLKARERVVRLEQNLDRVVVDLAAALEKQRIIETPGRPADIRAADLHSQKVELELRLLQAQRDLSQERGSAERKLQDVQATQRARQAFVLKTLDGAVRRELQALDAAQQYNPRTDGAAAIAAAAIARKPLPVTSETIARDAAVDEAARAYARAEALHQQRPTEITAADLVRSRQTLALATEQARDRQLAGAAVQQARYDTAVSALDRAIAREQRSEIRAAVDSTIAAHRLYPGLEFTAEERGNATKVVAEFKQARDAWRATFPKAAPGAAELRSADHVLTAEQKAERSALRQQLQSKADRLIADPAARQVASEQRLARSAERSSSLAKRIETQEVSQRRDAALAVVPAPQNTARQFAETTPAEPAHDAAQRAAQAALAKSHAHPGRDSADRQAAEKAILDRATAARREALLAQASQGRPIDRQSAPAEDAALLPPAPEKAPEAAERSLETAARHATLQKERPMPLTVEQATEIVEEFRTTYPSTRELTYTIKATQEELYGEHATKEAFGTLYGNYFPHSREFGVVASNSASADELRLTLSHELIGHYGINTCGPIEKRALIDSIAASRGNPQLQETWREVDRRYPDLSEPRKAEEVFATVCEDIRPDQRFDKALGAATLREIVRNPTRPIEAKQLLVVAAHIAEGMHDGTRSAQIIPATDYDQFRAKELSAALEPGRDRTQQQVAIDSPAQNLTREAVAPKLIEPDALNVHPEQAPPRARDIERDPAVQAAVARRLEVENRIGQVDARLTAVATERQRLEAYQATFREKLGGFEKRRQENIKELDRAMMQTQGQRNMLDHDLRNARETEVSARKNVERNNQPRNSVEEQIRDTLGRIDKMTPQERSDRVRSYERINQQSADRAKQPDQAKDRDRGRER